MKNNSKQTGACLRYGRRKREKSTAARHLNRLNGRTGKLNRLNGRMGYLNFEQEEGLSNRLKGRTGYVIITNSKNRFISPGLRKRALMCKGVRLF